MDLGQIDCGMRMGWPGTELNPVVSTAVDSVLPLGSSTTDCVGEFCTFKSKAKIQVWPPNTEQSNYTEYEVVMNLHLYQI
jgi:hypothetical protein